MPQDPEKPKPINDLGFFLGIFVPCDPTRFRHFHDPQGVTLGVTLHLPVSTSKSYSMARHLIPSDKTIRSIKPGDERRRLSDGEGLYQSTELKRWLLKLAA